MHFKEFFIIILMLMLMHASILVIMLSSRFKHLYAKLTSVRSYILRKKIGLKNCFFKHLYKPLAILITLAAGSLIINIFLILISFFLNKTDLESEQIVYKLALVFLCSFLLFDFLLFVFIIVLLAKFKSWKKINEANPEWKEIQTYFDNEIVIEQIDIINYRYVFEYSKFRFFNVKESFKPSDYKTYIYYWIVQDYEHLLINNKNANLNMFYDLYHRYNEK
ncbi:hypothetical protein JS510_03040 [Mycoplasma tauri]|uniref:MAG0920 family protein n=1 Tax=Mycoplasma tauri TaxID=547987 RepID=UPI0019687C39|nr:hypothetical protein [Mycoplasma tauri]QSB07458.1 hypothetical protein JS510_03040 [Mycoplasma tauri]